MVNRKIIAALASAAAFTAFATTAGAAEYGVAILQTLTGPGAFVGTGIKNGAALAAEEINRKQVLGDGNSLDVSVGDDSGDRTQAATLMQQYAANSKILVVMGPTSGSVALAGLAAANDKKLMAYATTNSRLGVATGPWGFIMTQPSDITTPYMASYAVDKLKVKNCGIISVIDNEAFSTYEKLFEDYFTQHGVKIVMKEWIKAADADFAAVSTKTASTKMDCLFISAFGPQGANLIRQLRQAGIDPSVRIIGHNGFAGPDLVTKGGTAVEGVYFMGDWAPGGNTDDGRAFNAAYIQKYGNAPDNWAAIGYSTMRVVANAIKTAGPNPTRDQVRQAMDKSKDVSVVIGQGTYSLDSDRVPHYGMQVLMVKNGQFVPAP